VAKRLRYSRRVQFDRLCRGPRPALSLGALAWVVMTAATAPLAHAVPGAVTGAAAPAPAATAPESSIFFPKPPAGDTSLAGMQKRAREKLRMGHALERAGQPAAAILAYQSATQLDPEIPEANYRMGMLFLSRNQIKPAAECFLQEVKHHPENLAAARQLGIASARLGESEAAIRQLEPMVRRNPNDAEAWAALGFAYMGAKRVREAEDALRRALTIKPGVSAWHRDLGVVLASQGNLSGARAEYAQAAKLDPHDATAWINLGNLERRQNRPDAALNAYRAAEARDTLSPLAYEGQVDVLKGAGRSAEAGQVYRRWLDRRPDDHRARLDAVRLYDDLGRTDISLEIAREGVREDPQSADARLIFGMALQSNGDWRGGLKAMRQAEATFRAPEDKARARALISSLRSQAPDSLRELFLADSLAHPEFLDSPVNRTPTRP
jgi:tetratricopeptide (TPR) repeat protein